MGLLINLKRYVRFSYLKGKVRTMTGPGPGKIKLDAEVMIIIGSKEFRVDVDTYLHIRG